MRKSQFFIITILFILLFQLHTASAHAQKTTVPSPSTYDLAYPGLLPDHPLYFLKVARDNVMGFFKGEPTEKASFALLQADKHMAATHVLLTQKNNPELATASLDTAQDYLEEAIIQTDSAKKEGMDTHEICHKLKQASKIHTLVLEELEKQMHGKDTTKLAEEKNRAEKLAKMASSLRP